MHIAGVLIFASAALAAVAGNPDYGNPDNNKPDYGKPGYNNPDHGKPDYHNPDHNKPDYGNPDHHKPEECKPDYNNPDKCKPGYHKPDHDHDHDHDKHDYNHDHDKDYNHGHGKPENKPEYGHGGCGPNVLPAPIAQFYTGKDFQRPPEPFDVLYFQVDRCIALPPPYAGNIHSLEVFDHHHCVLFRDDCCKDKIAKYEGKVPDVRDPGCETRSVKCFY